MQLLLIPTAIERERIPLELRQEWLGNGNAIELCGFGSAVAGIQATRWIHLHSPTSVILLGIAGSYTTGLVPGTAIEFSKVSCYGIGVGEGEEFQSASEMGWLQWPFTPAISDTIELIADAADERELLTVTAASASTLETGEKTRRYPAALAEDMEGFSVAAACLFAGVPLRIIRGISNYAGERNHRDWKIETSLQAAMELAILPTHGTGNIR